MSARKALDAMKNSNRRGFNIWWRRRGKSGETDRKWEASMGLRIFCVPGEAMSRKPREAELRDQRPSKARIWLRMDAGEKTGSQSAVSAVAVRPRKSSETIGRGGRH
jgi:hypothetical protein